MADCSELLEHCRTLLSTLDADEHILASTHPAFSCSDTPNPLLPRTPKAIYAIPSDAPHYRPEEQSHLPAGRSLYHSLSASELFVHRGRSPPHHLSVPSTKLGACRHGRPLPNLGEDQRRWNRLFHGSCSSICPGEGSHRKIVLGSRHFGFLVL